MTPVRYRTDVAVDVDEMIALYRGSRLGERRPVDDRNRMRRMLAEANLIVTAWDGERLVGMARCLSDFVYVTYVSDLAVDSAYQRRGIGTQLLAAARTAGPQARLVLLAAPGAVGYYPRIGFTPHPSAWQLPPDAPLGGVDS